MWLRLLNAVFVQRACLIDTLHLSSNIQSSLEENRLEGRIVLPKKERKDLVSGLGDNQGSRSRSGVIKKIEKESYKDKERLLQPYICLYNVK